MRFIASEKVCNNMTDAINCVPTRGEMGRRITQNSNPRTTASFGTIIRGIKVQVSQYDSLLSYTRKEAVSRNAHRFFLIINKITLIF